MAGHGCPQRERVRFANSAMRPRRQFKQRFPLSVVGCASTRRSYFQVGRLAWLFRLMPVLLLMVVVGPTLSHASEAVELRLRMVWGLGEPRSWEGMLEVEQGIYTELSDLGNSPDAPGSKFVQEGRLVIRSTGATSHDGMDVTIRGTSDARFVLVLRPGDRSSGGVRIDTTLGHFISQTEMRRLDAEGNQLTVGRAPGDRLRIDASRSSLVFAPHDPFSFAVKPHLLELEPQANLRVQLQLFPARGDREIWSTQSALRADNQGRVAQQRLDPVPLPGEEGVYDIVVSLYRRPRIEVPLWRTPPLAQRSLQVIVIDPNRRIPEPSDWRVELTLDPSNPRWRTWTTRWQNLVLLPGLDRVRLPGFDQSKPLESGPTRETEVLGQTMRQLDPGQWQAYPLPVSAGERPHLLEIEYPNHLPQTLGITILEPNEDGEVTPLHVDSGIHVPAHPVDEEPKLERHRIVFWPRTKAPIVLLTNLRDQGAATFGRIRLSSGPANLAPAPLDLPSRSERPQRLLAAYFDKPLFPANFSAREAIQSPVQASVGTSIDDWKKFHDGAQRLIEYLKYAGYNGAVICVARDGSTIYPSEVVAQSPRFDNGMFAGSGQDVLRKDVLEMLFRMFERDGLQLIPAVHFSGRVVSLERKRRQQPEVSTGIDLVDARGRAAPTRYNPLDPRVQEVMLDAVRELSGRYGQFESYGGIAVQWGADSFLAFPDSLWGLDDQTFERFLTDAGHDRERLDQLTTPALRGAWLENSERQRVWLEWRANELGRLAESMQQIACQPREEAKLYLATHGLLDGGLFPRLLQTTPSASQQGVLAEAMLRAGIDARLYRENAQMVMLKPQRMSPGRSLNEQAVDLHLATSNEADAYFSGDEVRQRLSPETGSLFFHERIMRRLPSFDAVSPFGPERTAVQLLAHVPPAGLYNRKRFAQSLALMDSQTLIDGGWLLPLGQEDVLLPLIETYRLLPRGRFQLVTPRSESRTQPIVVRQRNDSGETWFYLVNDSPWQASVSLEIHCAEGAELTTVGQRAFPVARKTDPGLQWRLSLAPYDVVAARVSDESAMVVDWQTQLAPEVFADLERQIREVGIRANLALERPSLDRLTNGDFEQEPTQENPIPGWQHKQGEQISVTLDGNDKYKGRYSLRLSSQGPVLWVRSAPFTPPATGRLYVLVRLKVSDPRQQPRLRVALDDEQGFYWPLPVGADSNQARLPATWSEDFLFPFEQLPVGELKQLQLGFDLMGAGEVWIDDIQMYDIWLQREDRNALLMARGLASKNLESYAKVSYCHRFLEGFWPRFLLEHVTPDTQPPAERPATTPGIRPVKEGDIPNAGDEAKPRTAMERLFEMVPRVPTIPTPFWR
jgi:hypothetical protein